MVKGGRRSRRNQCLKKKRKEPRFRYNENFVSSPDEMEMLQDDVDNGEALVRKVLEKFVALDFFKTLKKSLVLHLKGSSAIIAYGIGNFLESDNSLLQLVCLIAMMDIFQCRAFTFDPVSTAAEQKIAAKLGLIVLNQNDEGRRRVSERTLFFMPHCPMSLYINVLQANWGPNLARVSILGNRYTSIWLFQCVGVGAFVCLFLLLCAVATVVCLLSQPFCCR